MGPSPENTCVSEEVGSGATDTEKPASSKPQTTDSLTYHELLQEYTQLRERFLRTTNALGSAAHDLKTPLAILNGYVELLQSEKLGTLNDRQREVLHDMRSSGQRLQQFIQDFLSFSVLETGETKMRYEVGDVNACLSEVCRLWSHRFQERGLALYFLGNDKCPGLPLIPPRYSGSYRICWRMHLSSLLREEQSGCTASLTCGNDAPRTIPPCLASVEAKLIRFPTQ